MASKQVAYVDQVRTDDDIILEIDGLIATNDGTFILRGVKTVNVHYEHVTALRDAMIEQGVERRLADRLVDEALATVHIGLIADAIAQRTKRIG